jgi:hypothetical protein
MTPRSNFGIKRIMVAAIVSAVGLVGGARWGSAQEKTMPDSNSSNEIICGSSKPHPHARKRGRLAGER